MRLASGSILALVLATFSLAGCGDDSSSSGSGSGGDSGTGSGGSAGSGEGVACEDAKDGDACTQEGEFCGAIECYGCSSRCSQGKWEVSCSEAPTCAELDTVWGHPCDDFCGAPHCDAELATPCGTQTLSSECTAFGWAYPTECTPDCTLATDEGGCVANLNCIWAVPCEGSDSMEPVCRSLAAPAAQGGIEQHFCDDVACGADQACVEIAFDPRAATSGDCTSSGSVAAYCAPVGHD